MTSFSPNTLPQPQPQFPNLQSSQPLTTNSINLLQSSTTLNSSPPETMQTIPHKQFLNTHDSKLRTEPKLPQPNFDHVVDDIIITPTTTKVSLDPAVHDPPTHSIQINEVVPVQRYVVVKNYYPFKARYVRAHPVDDRWRVDDVGWATASGCWLIMLLIFSFLFFPFSLLWIFCLPFIWW